MQCQCFHCQFNTPVLFCLHGCSNSIYLFCKQLLYIYHVYVFAIFSSDSSQTYIHVCVHSVSECALELWQSITHQTVCCVGLNPPGGIWSRSYEFLIYLAFITYLKLLPIMIALMLSWVNVQWSPWWETPLTSNSPCHVTHQIRCIETMH